MRDDDYVPGGVAVIIGLGMLIIGALAGWALARGVYLERYADRHCAPACAGGIASADYKDDKFVCVCTRRLETVAQ